MPVRTGRELPQQQKSKLKEKTNENKRKDKEKSLKEFISSRHKVITEKKRYKRNTKNKRKRKKEDNSGTHELSLLSPPVHLIHSPI